MPRGALDFRPESFEVSQPLETCGKQVFHLTLENHYYRFRELLLLPLLDGTSSTNFLLASLPVAMPPWTFPNILRRCALEFFFGKTKVDLL